MKMKRRKVKNIPFRKIIPNMITSGSVLCGVLSMILILHGSFQPAAWLLFIAVFFDFMDGKVARSLGGSSAFGVELDSLADALSFGAVPAFLTYAVYIQPDRIGIWGALAAAFFTLCGVLRLARFNVTHVVGPFQGLPIPAAGLGLVSLVIGKIPLSSGLAIVAMISLAVLMVSSVPYGNLKKLRKGNVNLFRKRLLMVFALVVTIALRERAILAFLSLYVLSGPVGLDWGSWLAINPNIGEEESEEETHHICN